VNHEPSPPQTPRGALEAWVLNTLPRAVAFAMSLLADRHAADDVVHDCYCRLLHKAGEYDLLRDGTKLLFRAVTNACIDRQRQKKPLSLEGMTSGSALHDPHAREPLETLLHREMTDMVEATLACLPVQQRAALQLKSLGHSLHEIAATLQISVSNAGVLIHRARQVVAERLTRFREETA
jgi:RNA polymerase sigma-70 factor, ECF subfamily